MSSQFKSERDRFGLHSDHGDDAEPFAENSVGAPDDEPNGASPDDVTPGNPAAADLQLGPMSEETKARYSELLIALEQTITQAVRQPDIPPNLPSSSVQDAFDDDVARMQPQAPRSSRLPPALSPFAPPKFRSFVPEPPLAEPSPFGPPPRSLFTERRSSFEHDDARRAEETVPPLKLQTRPHPPAPRRPEPAAGGRALLRRSAFAGVATGVVIVVGALYLSHAAQPPSGSPASATPSAPQRAFSGTGDRQPGGRTASRIVLTDLNGPKNRPIALGVTIEAPPQGASVVVKGVPSGTRVTSGTAIGGGTWRIPLSDIAHAAVIPPLDYVGAMHLAVDLRLADDTVADSDVLRLEWTQAAAETVVPKPVKTTVIAGAGNPFPAPPAPPTPPAPPAATATDASGALAALASARPNAAPVEPQAARPPDAAPAVRQLDREEVATLVERGLDFLENGDIAAARLLLRRAADAGHAQAAMALGSTYDPAALKELGALGVAANVVTARAWYEKASQLGSAEAIRRLQRLAQQSQ